MDLAGGFFIDALAIFLEDEIVENLFEVIEALGPFFLSLLHLPLFFFNCQDYLGRLSFFLPLLLSRCHIVNVLVLCHDLSLLQPFLTSDSLFCSSLDINQFFRLQVARVDGKNGPDIDVENLSFF